MAVVSSCREISRPLEAILLINPAHNGETLMLLHGQYRGKFSKLFMHINKDCQDVVIGTLLGDDYLSKRGALQIEHAEKDKEYVLWKHQKMNKILAGPISCPFVERLDKRNGKHTFSCRFYTKAIFSEYRTLFYPNGKKVVPDNIYQLLTYPLALATLFMDDGGKGGNTSKGMVLSLAGFLQSDQEKLRECLSLVFDLDTHFCLFVFLSNKKVVNINNFIYQVAKTKNY